MARIDVLPSIEIIRGLKGILDFYVWRGLPCVRAWPKYRPAKQTAASLAAALTFGAVVKAYSLLATQALAAYREAALDQPRTARDIMVTGVYGNLHEASMSDFLDALIIIRDAIVAQTALLHALHSVDTDELMVRTQHSVLPDGASTAAAQATQLTALQKLDDLQDALQSKALDRLLVRGQDQLFSFKGVLAETASADLTEASGAMLSDAVPAGLIWIITNITALDVDNATTGHVYYARHNLTNYEFERQYAALAANRPSSYHGWVTLDPEDTIQVTFIGALNGDSCKIILTGYEMTLET